MGRRFAVARAILDSLKQAAPSTMLNAPVQAGQGARSAPLAGCLEAFELATNNGDKLFMSRMITKSDPKPPSCAFKQESRSTYKKVKSMKHPSIGQRALLGAQQGRSSLTAAQKMTGTVQVGSEEQKTKKFEEAEELVGKILDRLIEVQSTLLMFRDMKRWDNMLLQRGIPAGSLFAYQLKTTLIAGSIQSFCRLWDPVKNRYPKIGFNDLWKVLRHENLLDDLLERSLKSNTDPEDLPGWYDKLRDKSELTYQFIIQDINNIPTRYNASTLKKVRDKWISHNDVDFDVKTIGVAWGELPTFFDETVVCFDKINALVRDAGFAWESVSRPIERDAAKFFDVPPRPDKDP